MASWYGGGRQEGRLGVRWGFLTILATTYYGHAPEGELDIHILEMPYLRASPIGKSLGVSSFSTECLAPSLSFPGGSVVKNSPMNAGDTGLSSRSGRSTGEGNGNPFQYSCLGSAVDRGAWQATVHGGHKRVRHDLATEQQKPSSCPLGS